jgi:MerR family transcriptional regulator, copper efflux regulator
MRDHFPLAPKTALDLPTVGNPIFVAVAELRRRATETTMNIGQAAKASGVSAKMLRYYESIGLIPKAGRTDAGYRTYGEADVNTLRFIRRARDLGLPIERIKLLVGLWRDKGRPSAEVKRIAAEHVAELRAKIAELAGMCAALQELADACHGDHRPECPILRDLEGGPGSVAPIAPAARKPGRAKGSLAGAVRARARVPGVSDAAICRGAG